jgi:hypothetical protein
MQSGKLPQSFPSQKLLFFHDGTVFSTTVVRLPTIVVFQLSHRAEKGKKGKIIIDNALVRPVKSEDYPPKAGPMGVGTNGIARSCLKSDFRQRIVLSLVAKQSLRSQGREAASEAGQTVGSGCLR